MEEVRTLAVKILDEARAEIQANMAKNYRTSKGVRWIDASGASSAAFQVETSPIAVRLVFKGDDVAPLESIQYGYKGDSDIESLRRWREIKERQGAEGLPSAEVMQKRIKEIGTERFNEPQEWVINPVVEKAVETLREQLPREAVRAVKNLLFGPN